MKTGVLRGATALLLLLAGVGPAWGGFALQDSDTVVFLGDGLVGQAQIPVFVETFVRARYPQCKARFVSLGRAGETAASLREHVGETVGAMQPKATVAVVCLGLFETSLNALSEEARGAFAQDYEAVVGALQSAGLKVVVMTPPSVEEQRNNRLRELSFNEQVIGKLAEEIRGVAERSGASLVDWYEVSIEDRARRTAQDPRFGFSRDGLRPLSEGEALSATLLLEQWGAEPIQAQVALNWESGEASSDPPGVTAERVSGREMRLRFSDFPLPWVLTAGRGEKQSADWYAHRLARIELKVQKLTSPGLVLEMNGRPVPVVRQQLEAGFDLSSAELFQEAPASQKLMQLIDTRNKLLLTKQEKAASERPTEPELVPAFEALLHAYDLYYSGYATLVERCPRTLGGELTLKTLDSTLQSPGGAGAQERSEDRTLAPVEPERKRLERNAEERRKRVTPVQRDDG